MFRWHYIKDNEYPLDEEECFCEVVSMIDSLSSIGMIKL